MATPCAVTVGDRATPLVKCRDTGFVAEGHSEDSDLIFPMRPSPSVFALVEGPDRRTNP